MKLKSQHVKANEPSLLADTRYSTNSINEILWYTHNRMNMRIKCVLKILHKMLFLDFTSLAKEFKLFRATHMSKCSSPNATRNYLSSRE
jgi:hypothetical protein